VIVYVVAGYLIAAVAVGGVVWGFHRAARQRMLLRQRKAEGQGAYEVQHYRSPPPPTASI
jgi:hypothetical protein